MPICMTPPVARVFVVFVLLASSIADSVFSASSETRRDAEASGMPRAIPHYAYGACKGSFDASQNQTGWSKLRVVCDRRRISTAPVRGKHEDTDWLQAFAAGKVEGVLTGAQIELFLDNFAINFAPFWKQFPHLQDRLNAWVSDWFKYVYEQSDLHWRTDPYWANVRVVLAQVSGLTAGVNEYLATLSSDNRQQSATIRPRTELELLILNSGADTMELVQFWTESTQSLQNNSSWFETARTAQESWVNAVKHSLEFGRTHCSSLVQIGPCAQQPQRRTTEKACGASDASNIAVGHTTWGQYLSMLRIVKSFDVQWTFDGSRSTILFSSYPGFLFSGDDFLVKRPHADATGALVVVETTLNVFNSSLLADLHPEGVVLTWVRGMVATRMSQTPQIWTKEFARYSSGTYTNSWSIVGSGELWILEEMPGLVEFGNLTDHLLANGYYASYNIPYYRRVYNYGGYQKMADKYGDLWKYDSCPRAKQFSALHCENIETVMQYNDWQHDPTSFGSPTHAIASRFDLAPRNSSDYMGLGAIDSKIAFMRNGHVGETVRATCGPTHQQQPVFEWVGNPLSAEISHLGQPPRFDFAYETIPIGV